MRFSGKFLSSGLVVGALALSLSLPVAGQTSQIGARPSLTVALSNIRISNFGEINANYFRGAQPKGQDYDDLAGLGVKTVINLISDGKSDEQEMVEHAGMSYFHIPMTTSVPPTQEQIAEFLSLVNDPARQPVYVHCVGGKHRTGVMTAVYRMTDDGWSADQAFQEMKQYKFGADFMHPEFKKFVYNYHPDRSRVAVTKSSGGASETGTK